MRYTTSWTHLSAFGHFEFLGIYVTLQNFSGRDPSYLQGIYAWRGRNKTVLSDTFTIFLWELLLEIQQHASAKHFHSPSTQIYLSNVVTLLTENHALAQ